MLSYIRQSDFTGKKVAAFWTNQGTPGDYYAEFKKEALAKGATLLHELRLANAKSMRQERLEQKLNDWLSKLQIVSYKSN